MFKALINFIRWWPVTWYSSDLHIAHKNVITYCQRPFKDVSEMNDHIVRYWNRTVKPFDTIYILGDYSLNPKWSRDLVPKLNGYKILVAGNHDACHISHKKWVNMVERYKRDGWDEVYPHMAYKTLKNGLEVALCHLPYVPDNPDYDVRYLNLRPERGVRSFLLHGHSHGCYKKDRDQIDVGWDAHGGVFLTEDDLIKLIEDDRQFIPSPLTEYFKNNKEKVIIKKEI